MELNDQNFKQEAEEGKGLVLVDFFAPWCGPCKLMGPIIEELAKDYKDKGIKIAKLNVDESKKTAEKYEVLGIPTIILFKDGKILEQMTGYQSKEALEEMINKNI
ncbi:thioredoxin [Candidatus Falkowbacteria bacterium CG11_big_fil_rev_8_21_14_0_20_39_10]|uniref:Thioredoxin n=1 Tax=Candidatus Falkowbacteria bacterium CG11_big_fil_rev_8_21_14_0_20_39_10 TaxID=1974570 RepID=A0A2M6K9U6_9BACT|nr:MAG: thioredoxin [Candidatus Falkowbacteria bacterium CG11_big_fil_rev_8_21_14_0_20_39_10]